jgi:hypothetical protein
MVRSTSQHGKTRVYTQLKSFSPGSP